MCESTHEPLTGAASSIGRTRGARAVADLGDVAQADWGGKGGSDQNDDDDDDDGKENSLALRQVTLAARKRSTGHVAAMPSHTSTTSLRRRP